MHVINEYHYMKLTSQEQVKLLLMIEYVRDSWTIREMTDNGTDEFDSL